MATSRISWIILRLGHIHIGTFVTPIVDIHAAQTQLARLLAAAIAGEDVIITRAGKPIARLIPIAEAQPPRRLGTLDGKLTVPDNFDDPLPADILDAFEGR